MSYQFIHFDAYAREGSKQTKTVTKKNGNKITTTKQVKSLRQIMEEQTRIEEACPHIQEPRRPGILYGVPPMEVLPIAEEWAESATDSIGRKLRKDGMVALVGVASLPREMEDNFPEFAEDTLKWLKNKYGDRLKSVVVHNDESHPHLHFTVVPRIGERFDDIHEGIKAKNLAKKEGKNAGAQNLAYIESMRHIQDDYSNQVALKHGLTRLGPGRRRLTRGEWQAEKAQAAFFSDAKAVYKDAKKRGYKDGLKKAEQIAIDIITKAKLEAKSIGNKMSSWVAGLSDGWHQPSAKALAVAEKIKDDAEKEKKKAEKIKTQAKDWADKRVAEVANQLTQEKTKTKNLEKELDRAEKSLAEMAEGLEIYNKKYGDVKSL